LEHHQKLTQSNVFESQIMQQKAAQYLASAKGIGADEAVLFGILEDVGKHHQQDAFDKAVGQLKKHHTALSVAEREFADNPLKRKLFQAKLERSKQLYAQGKESKTNLSDAHYRMEGALNIPLGLYNAFKNHFVACAGTLVGIAMFASCVPYVAAQLSNLITLMSAAMVVKSEVNARKHPKGSVERQEALKESGEGLTGMAINFIPLAEVTEHLQHGRAAIKQAVKGLDAVAQHADEAADAGGIVSMLTDSAKAVPTFITENLKTLGDMLKAGKTAVTNPAKFVGNDLPKGVKAGLAYDSSVPETLAEFKKAKTPGQITTAAVQAIKKQATLAVTLIDEILFPMVKILQSSTGGAATSPAPSAQPPQHKA
jgi:hypothetical protein